MKITIILDNFQQTKHAELTFNSGLTVIKGLNNNGKSSLIRAINAVVFNNPRKTKNYIKNGTKSCSVTILVEGYKQITWKKTTKEVTYQIGDDKPIEKAGRLCLKDVYSDHPFTLFEDNLLFNVIAQKQKPIPFNQTSSQVFAIFEELYGVLSTKEDISKFTKQTNEYNSQLASNKQTLDTLHEKEVALHKFQNSVNATKLLTLKNKLQETQNTLNTLENLKHVVTVLKTNKKLEIPVSSIGLQSSIIFLKQLKQIKKLKEDLSTKKKLITPINPKDFAVYTKLQNILKIDTRLKALQAKKVDLKDKIKSLKETLPVCPTCKRPF